MDVIKRVLYVYIGIITVSLPLLLISLFVLLFSRFPSVANTKDKAQLRNPDFG